jgi:hypothetical protein
MGVVQGVDRRRVWPAACTPSEAGGRVTAVPPLCPRFKLGAVCRPGASCCGGLLEFSSRKFVQPLERASTALEGAFPGCAERVRSSGPPQFHRHPSAWRNRLLIAL